MYSKLKIIILFVWAYAWLDLIFFHSGSGVVAALGVSVIVFLPEKEDEQP